MRRGLLAFFCCLGFSAPASAQDVPIVRIVIEPEVVSVGEPVELRITVLSPTWFPKPPVYPSFELANAMTRVPPDSSYPTSERVGSESWSGIVRSYEIYPLIGATYRFDANMITVTWADPATRSPLTREIDLPSFEFRAVVPSGAEALDPYLAGRSFTITRDIEGDVDSLSVGDALVVHYTAELVGLAAVFLPPMFSDPRAQGAAVYAKEPVVEDGARARRVETLTFVLETSGELTLPGVAFEWWDTTTGTIETASVPALSLPVSGTLLSVIEPGSATGTVSIGLLIVGFVAAAVFARRWLPWLRSRWRAAAETRLHSEAHAFAVLRRSLRAGDPQAIHRTLLVWLARLQPGIDARDFAQEHGDTVLQQGVEGVVASLYSSRNVSFETDSLEPALRAARKRLLGRREEAAHSSLPPLNR